MVVNRAIGYFFVHNAATGTDGMELHVSFEVHGNVGSEVSRESECLRYRIIHPQFQLPKVAWDSPSTMARLSKLC